MTDFPMDAEELARQIDIPLDQWGGNCHGIAQAILDLVPVKGMRLARGHYTGYISRASVYSGPFCQHTWLVAEDGRILDPTRWAMDRPKSPYIYLGEDDCYDEAGLELANKIPPMMPTGKPDMYQQSLAGKDPEALKAIALALGKAADSNINTLAYSVEWALKSPPEHLTDAPAFYGAMKNAGLKALIKIDLWHLVMEPERLQRTSPSNRYFELPQAKKLTRLQIFHRILCKFISIESRECDIESELEELGYSLDDWHDALNKSEWFIKDDETNQLNFIPNRILDTLVVVSSWLLGKGRGVDIRVERFAKSIGADRKELDSILRESGKRVGYDNSWI